MAERVYRKPARAQVRMASIETALRRALDQADRRYWDSVARAAEDAQDPAAALMVSYPDIANVGTAYGDSLAFSWEDAGAWTLWALAKRGRGLLLGAKAGAARRNAASVRDPVETGSLGGLRPSAPAGRGATGQVLTNASSRASLEEQALQLILEGEVLVIPRASIERYVADHMPQLRAVLDEKRRGTCRDVISRAAGEGLDVRRTAAALKAEGFGQSAWHRENIARTEAAHLYSAGSVARYRASGAVTGLRFEAVMDDRTSDVCADLHGRVFRSDDVDGVTPPLHFQCRSELQPVLFDETPESFDTTAGFLADRGTANPLPGFGALDVSGMPAARGLKDLYQPLVGSDRAEMRELYQKVMDAGRKRWGEQWAA